MLLNQVAFSLELLEWEGTFSGFGGSENSGREGFKNGTRNGNIIFYQTSNNHLEKRDWINLERDQNLRVSRIPVCICRGGSRIFFRRGCTRLLLYFSTNKPHSFFFAEYQLYKKTAGHLRGGVRTPCTLPLDPPLICTTWTSWKVSSCQTYHWPCLPYHYVWPSGEFNCNNVLIPSLVTCSTVH